MGNDGVEHSRGPLPEIAREDRKSTRLNSSHLVISYAVFCLKKKNQQLKKMTKQVTLALDPDAAGATATEHGIQEALKGFDRTVVPVPLAADARMTAAMNASK